MLGNKNIGVSRDTCVLQSSSFKDWEAYQYRLNAAEHGYNLKNRDGCDEQTSLSKQSHGEDHSDRFIDWDSFLLETNSELIV